MVLFFREFLDWYILLCVVMWIMIGAILLYGLLLFGGWMYVRLKFGPNWDKHEMDQSRRPKARP